MNKGKNTINYLFCTVLIMMIFLTACNSGASANDSSSSVDASTDTKNSSSDMLDADVEQTESFIDDKILVVYFSQSGHTKTLANQIHDQVGGDLFEITLEEPYPSDYGELDRQAQKELKEDYKPRLKTEVEDMESYNVIFIGTPIWYLKMTPPVKSFLSDYDFSGKTIIPFYTYGGAGGSVVSDIKKLCPKATVQEDALAIRDSEVDSAQNTVADWLKKIQIVK